MALAGGVLLARLGTDPTHTGHTAEQATRAEAFGVTAVLRALEGRWNCSLIDCGFVVTYLGGAVGAHGWRRRRR